MLLEAQRARSRDPYNSTETQYLGGVPPLPWLPGRETQAHMVPELTTSAGDSPFFPCLYHESIPELVTVVKWPWMEVLGVGTFCGQGGPHTATAKPGFRWGCGQSLEVKELGLAKKKRNTPRESRKDGAG